MAPRLQPTVRNADNEAAAAEARVFRRAAAPGAVDGADLGDLWEDISGTPVLKQCTSTSPYTWVAVDTTGAGTITGGGTNGTLAKFTGATAIGDSAFTDAGLRAELDTKLAAPSTRKSAWVNFWPGNLTPTPVGFPSLSTGGTMSDGTTAAAPFQTFTTASSGAVFGVWGNTSIFLVETRHDPIYDVDFMTGADISDVRIFVGLVNAVQHNADADNRHLVGIRYSTTAADPGWVGVCCDGTTANQQVTAQIAAIAASTRYRLKIVVSGAGTLVTFTVNGGTPQTLSVNLPTTSTPLNWNALGGNLAVETKALRLANVSLAWGIPL